MTAATQQPSAALRLQGRLGRRAFLGLCASAPAWAGAACRPAAWPLWQRFVEKFLQADGRIIDFSVPQMHSTSEGQAYGMFFALVANDPDRFERIWRWSVAQLAQGRLDARLPAWQWGQRKDGTWGVLDSNPASDADLWFAYTLLEAARLWQRPVYATEARTLMARIVQDEVVQLPGLGAMLLPAPVGFHNAEQGQWRLNPSYLPPQVLRRLAQAQPQGPWKELLRNTVRMIEATTPRQLAANWVAYQAEGPGAGGRFLADPKDSDLGSYDAIRNYLWAGMLPPQDPLAAPLQKQLGGLTPLMQALGAPPEKIRAATGQYEGAGPAGFSAALLPLLKARGAKALLQRQSERTQNLLLDAAAGATRPYYDHVLGLFGTGWIENRYQFLPSGRLQTDWEKACPNATTR